MAEDSENSSLSVKHWLASHGRVLLPDDLEDLDYSKLGTIVQSQPNETRPRPESGVKNLHTVRIMEGSSFDEIIEIEPGIVGTVTIINNTSESFDLRVKTEQ